MRMLFIFIDGFGLGQEDERINPIYAAKTPALDYIFNHFTVIPTDTALGVQGLPQSATGQTAIFTGVNASEILGRHMSGQPTITLKKLISANNLFKALIAAGFSVTNANVYRNEYLVKMHDPRDRRHRPSVTSVMTMSAGIEFRTVEHYKLGKGVYHDITGQVLMESGYDVEPISPQEAAQRLYSLSRDYDFTLYEHFMTDLIGHKGDMNKAVRHVEMLDAFLGEIVRLVDLKEDVIFITSDHGNIEDITARTHTLNKIPTVIGGNASMEACSRIKSLVDIMPAVLEIFDIREMHK